MELIFSIFFFSGLVIDHFQPSRYGWHDDLFWVGLLFQEHWRQRHRRTHKHHGHKQ